MSRRYAQIATQVWRDPDFRGLSSAAQRVYMLLFSQPDISAAGILPLTVRRWAALAGDTTQDDILGAIQELEKGQYVVVDYDTEELLIRSFTRWDGGVNNPKRQPVILKAAEAVTSLPLRHALSREFTRLGLPQDALSDSQSDNPSDSHPHTPGVVVKQVVPIATHNPQPTTHNNPGADAPSQNRPDVDRLCDHLADRVEANGSKRPTITQKWRDAARLMLDRDGRNEEQVRKAIDWSQDHEFWRSNVMSMPKLREKYDQLRLQATSHQGNGTRPSTTDQRVGAALDLASKYAQEGQ